MESLGFGASLCEEVSLLDVSLVTVGLKGDGNEGTHF